MPKPKYCDCVSKIPDTVKIGYKNYKLEEWKQKDNFFLKKVL